MIDIGSGGDVDDVDDGDRDDDGDVVMSVKAGCRMHFDQQDTTVVHE